MTDFLDTLLLAARRRQRVVLGDGREGTLVYVPTGQERRSEKPLRHGDPNQCGVHIDGDPTGRVTPVPLIQIAALQEPSAAS